MYVLTDISVILEIVFSLYYEQHIAVLVAQNETKQLISSQIANYCFTLFSFELRRLGKILSGILPPVGNGTVICHCPLRIFQAEHYNCSNIGCSKRKSKTDKSE